jgi:hypothetical protein
MHLCIHASRSPCRYPCIRASTSSPSLNDMIVSPAFQTVFSKYLSQSFSLTRYAFTQLRMQQFTGKRCSTRA